mmetsp:Transcript_155342/g.289837  ORF Transcript_155342/g.289837 Transcript_155342/m.289837 type:complete len:278 (+) Transcript_155342:39-872(+)
MMSFQGCSSGRSFLTFVILFGLLLAGAQGFYGSYPTSFGTSTYPHHRGMHIHSPFSHAGSTWDGYGHDDFYSSSYRRQPCPVYQGMEVSQWARHASDDLAASVALPGVRPSHRQVTLHESGTAIHIRAFRALTARRACLPKDAEISYDGSAEVFDTVLNVPKGWDASRARVRSADGGLQIFVPLTKAAQRIPRHTFAPDSVSHASAPNTFVHKSEEQRTQQSAFLTKEVNFAKQDGWLLKLPSSHGIEVVEEEFPAPVKSGDAAEGFWDNRGEFQYY